MAANPYIDQLISLREGMGFLPGVQQRQSTVFTPASTGPPVATLSAPAGGSRSQLFGKFGDPHAANWAANNLTWVSAGGQRWQVNKQAAAAFQGLVNELSSMGYKLQSGGGYNLRDVRGKPGVPSIHSWGLAIDINPSQNPMGGSVKTNLPANIGQIARKYGLYWGGDWQGSRKDPMHFSYFVNG